MVRRLAIVLAIGLVPAQACAVINQAVEDACQSEYLTYCFGMKIPSEPLRACSRANMYKLSLRCAKAMVDNGEATNKVLTRSLANYFGPRVLEPRAYQAKYWDEDSDILGHISFATPGCWSLYGSAWGAPIGSIHWAATETSSKSFAQMNGAYRSGLSAADEILSQY